MRPEKTACSTKALGHDESGRSTAYEVKPEARRFKVTRTCAVKHSGNTTAYVETMAVWSAHKRQKCP